MYNHDIPFLIGNDICSHCHGRHSMTFPCIPKLNSEISRLTQQVAVLREALEPFAEPAKRISRSYPDETSLDQFRSNLTVGHLRKAARALQEHEGER